VLPFLLAAALAGIGLTACSGGGSGESDSGNCPTPGVTHDQVVAGLIYPDSGPLARDFEAFRGGVDARLGVSVKEGGVYGRRVVLKWADDAATSSANLSEAESLVTQQHVFGIMELTTAAGGSADWLHQQGIPVTGEALDLSWGGYDNMFTYAYLVGKGAGITTYGQFIKSHGGTHAALLYVSNELSMRLTDALAASLSAAGVPVVDRIEVTPGISSPQKAAARIRASGADVVTGVSTEADFAAIVNDARQQGATIKVALSPSGYGSSNRTLKWPDGAFTYLPHHPFETRSPAISRFLSAMSQYAPEIQPTTSSPALHGWLTADLFLRGLQEAGACPTRDAFLRGLRNVKDYDANGILVDKRNFANKFGVANPCLSFIQFNANTGSWNAVTGAEPLCGQQITAPSS
jgi:ABC-type branched-subunit amino acid transport system substrate-binding protein